MMKRSILILLAAAVFLAPLSGALAAAEKEQQAVDRAWLYLTQEQGIPGELLQEATFETLPVTLFGPERLVELVAFSSALSSNVYSVYMEPGSGGDPAGG